MQSCLHVQPIADCSGIMCTQNIPGRPALPGMSAYPDLAMNNLPTSYPSNVAKSTALSVLPEVEGLIGKIASNDDEKFRYEDSEINQLGSSVDNQDTELSRLKDSLLHLKVKTRLRARSLERLGEIKLKPGAQGKMGRPGPPGEPGPQGTPLMGPQGVMGPAGMWGDPGPVGEQGIPGPDGLQGPTGPRGMRGKRGYRGRPGIAGKNGPPGKSGLPGFQGIEGARGKPGKNGALGLPGNQGVPGSPGIDGPTGPRGATGPQGVQGPVGEPGAVGPAGIPGVWGRMGAAGPAGIVLSPCECTRTSLFGCVHVMAWIRNWVGVD